MPPRGDRPEIGAYYHDARQNNAKRGLDTCDHDYLPGRINPKGRFCVDIFGCQKMPGNVGTYVNR